jgi:hypothetical protein
MTAKNAALIAMTETELRAVIQRLHFEESKSIRDVARALGIPYASLRTEALRLGIVVKSRKQSLSDKFSGRGPNWAGGRSVWRSSTRKGAPTYVLVFRPEHPNANCRGYILEHRYVMSERIGRPLEEREIVHHVNGDTMDNSPENLEVRLRGGAGNGHGPLTVCPRCGHDLLSK